MNDTQRRIRRRRNVAGFSVVEVLVAISLLIVGIVAILEVFPPGFQAMNQTKNTTLAAQAGSGAFSSYKAEHLDQLGVIASQVNPTTDNTTAGVNLFTYGTPPNAANDGINSERIIGGEVARIPQNLYAVTNAATYPVNFGPIDVSPGAAASALTVNGSPWTAIPAVAFIGTSQSPAGVLSPIQDIPEQVLQNDQPEYMIDYSSGAIALPYESSMGLTAAGTGYVQVVQLSIVAGDHNEYSTTVSWDPTSGGQGTYWQVDPTTTKAEPLWFAPNPGPGTWKDANGNPVAAPVSSGQLPWVSGSAVLGRNFVQVPMWSTPSAAPADPYVFALRLGNIVTTSTQAANPGILAFDPTATAMRDGSGKPPIIKVNYWVADWHVLSEDHTVTSAGSIRLNLGSVDQLGQLVTTPITSNGTVIYDGTYNGLFDHIYDPTGSGTPTPEIYVINLNTGGELYPGVDYTLDSRLYSTGVITLTNPTTLLNARLRVFYRARGEWSINVLKAAAYYTPNPQGLVNAGSPPTQPPPSPLSLLANVATYQVSADGLRLLFPLTDVGKMVQITGLHVVNGAVKSVINDASIYSIEPPASPSSLQMGYVDFATDTTLPAGNNSGANVLFTPGESIDTSIPNPVNEISGCSVTVRVVYYEQNGQMRYQDFQSFLPPGPSI